METLSDLEIRRSRYHDFDWIYRFINDLGPNHHSKNDQLRLFQGNMHKKEILYLTALYQNTPVGFISCHFQQVLHHGGTVGEIQELFVAGDARLHGVGRLLVTTVVDYCKAHGIGVLEVASNKGRTGAHSFYGRLEMVFSHFKFTKRLFDETTRYGNGEM